MGMAWFQSSAGASYQSSNSGPAAKGTGGTISRQALRSKANVVINIRERSIFSQVGMLLKYNFIA
jgi:hypothetical protein